MSLNFLFPIYIFIFVFNLISQIIQLIIKLASLPPTILLLQAIKRDMLGEIFLDC